MKKKFIIGIILVMILFGLSGCNEQKSNDQDNIEINYNDMFKFVGVWVNRSGGFLEYYLISEDGKIYTLDEEQGQLLQNDYENFSKIVLEWDTYEKYRFVNSYFEL